MANAPVESVAMVEFSCTLLVPSAGCSDKGTGPGHINDRDRFFNKKKGNKVNMKNVTGTRADIDGMAIIGHTIFDLRGIRFVEGEEGNEPVVPIEPEPVDLSVYEAKIAELETTISDLNEQLTAKDVEITACKAANYDLLMSIPNESTAVDTTVVDPEISDVDIDDLFEKGN